jgi:L-arabinose isomerase
MDARGHAGRLQGARFCRFGDNMRIAGRTVGNKVSAEAHSAAQFNGYGMGELVARINAVPDAGIGPPFAVTEYTITAFNVAHALRRGGYPATCDARPASSGLRAFLEEGSFMGFTDTFEDLHGMQLLPGLDNQRLMADGYGGGAGATGRPAPCCAP